MKSSVEGGFETLFVEIEQHVQLLSNTVLLYRLFDSLNMARGSERVPKPLPIDEAAAGSFNL